MDNLPVHMRITGLQVTNEDVDFRRGAIGDVAVAWSKLKTSVEFLETAADIATALGGDGSASEELSGEVQNAMHARGASAFLASEQPLDVGICAGMAALSVMATERTSTSTQLFDRFAAALWSALAFQPPLPDARREALRTEVLAAAQGRAMLGAERSRLRVAVADFGDLTVTVDEERKATTTFKKVTLNTIDALRRNAELDREELDFLWWVQLGRSRLLGRALDAIDEAPRQVACGIEASTHLRRLPAEVHRDLVLRTLDQDPELNLKALLSALGEDRARLAVGFNAGVSDYASVFPLLNAIVSGVSTGITGAVSKRTAAQWGARALLEATLARLAIGAPAP